MGMFLLFCWLVDGFIHFETALLLKFLVVLI